MYKCIIVKYISIFNNIDYTFLVNVMGYYIYNIWMCYNITGGLFVLGSIFEIDR